jgi:hypothetical protein
MDGANPWTWSDVKWKRGGHMKHPPLCKSEKVFDRQRMDNEWMDEEDPGRRNGFLHKPFMTISTRPYRNGKTVEWRARSFPDRSRLAASKMKGHPFAPQGRIGIRSLRLLCVLFYSYHRPLVMAIDKFSTFLAMFQNRTRV